MAPDEGFVAGLELNTLALRQRQDPHPPFGHLPPTGEGRVGRVMEMKKRKHV